MNPGRRPDQPEPNLASRGDRDTNRPRQYNILDNKYARAIVDELLPVLYKDYNIYAIRNARYWRVEFRRDCR
jgi:hypothetical protein